MTRPVTPAGQDDATPARAAILHRAIAVLASAGPTATGATVIYPDGTTAYLARATADAMQDSKPTGCVRNAGGRA